MGRRAICRRVSAFSKPPFCGDSHPPTSSAVTRRISISSSGRTRGSSACRRTIRWASRSPRASTRRSSAPRNIPSTRTTRARCSPRSKPVLSASDSGSSSGVRADGRSVKPTRTRSSASTASSKDAASPKKRSICSRRLCAVRFCPARSMWRTRRAGTLSSFPTSAPRLGSSR